MASHYSFFNDGPFHIQCEWLSKEKLDLDNASLDQDNSVVYCLITVTDLIDYYTCKITRELLQTNFRESNALHKEHRSSVLEAAFLGEQSFYGNRLHWKVTKDKETSQLNMRLRTFNGDIALIVGSFFLDRAAPDQAQELERLWFKNGSMASQSNIEVTKILKQRDQDIKKTNCQLRDLIETIERKKLETFIVMMDKFVHLLNAKKRKIYHLQNSISRKRHRAIEEQEKVKAEANAKAKEEQEEIQPSKKLKTGEKTEEIINHPDQDNEESDWELSDSDINPPQTVR